MKLRQWRWIGHVFRREKDNNRVAVTLTAEGRRRHGRPKIMWRRAAKAERKDLDWTSWNRQNCEQRTVSITGQPYAPLTGAKRTNE